MLFTQITTYTMLFDFKETYKNYTNTALLKILLQPGKYQPEALAAAQALLDGRIVTEEDHRAAEAELNASLLQSEQKTLRQQAYKDKAIDLLEPVLNPGTEVKPEKWLNILLIAVTLQYLWSVYSAAQSLRFLIGDSGWHAFNTTGQLIWWAFSNYIELLLAPLVIFLLYKRRKWGWILLFGNSLFVVIGHIFNIAPLIAYLRLGLDNPDITFLLELLFYSAFSFFLWRDDITTLFGVTAPLKKRTGLVVALLSVLLFSIITLLV